MPFRFSRCFHCGRVETIVGQFVSAMDGRSLNVVNERLKWMVKILTKTTINSHQKQLRKVDKYTQFRSAMEQREVGLPRDRIRGRYQFPVSQEMSAKLTRFYRDLSTSMHSTSLRKEDRNIRHIQPSKFHIIVLSTGR